jgi:hypothetical protein
MQALWRYLELGRSSPSRATGQVGLSYLWCRNSQQIKSFHLSAGWENQHMLHDPLSEALVRGEARGTQLDTDDGTIWLPVVAATVLLASAVFAIASGV